ncbi:MAG: glycoside hydrolase family 3 N-terminal domain-containing protein [Porphyromonas sp.]|nr:glycoside hydrolase family 3 N-terminal domain-containing protein [Porphyromonas sp.]
MRRRFLLVAILIMGLTHSELFAQQPKQDPNVEARITEIISQMSLQEKVGQMAQYTLDVFGKGENVYTSYEPFELDTAMLEQGFKTYRIGSVLNTANNRALTPQVWQRIITTLQEYALKYTNIPLLYGIDSNRGTTYTDGGTFFPVEIGMAATFNTDLVEEGARVSAYETRASNIPWTFCPTMDLGRDPRWSRMWESFGEDTYLNTVLGLATVRGFQGPDPANIGRDHIAACPKHYLGYGVPHSGKDRTPAFISESDLREKFFEPFRVSIVDGGALSIMVNSGIINGVSTHADHRLLTEWLKEDLNFDGVIVTDWQDIRNLQTRDHLSEDYRGAIKMAINAGIDMVMEPYNFDFCELLVGLVNDGEVSMERIDDAVRRVLRMKFRLGLFETPSWDFNEYSEFNSAEHIAAAKLSADESITLLKNDSQLLPLSRETKILVTGPNANSMRPLNGGWAYSWQGEKVDEFTEEFDTFYEAIAREFGDANVTFAPGVSYNMDGEYYEELEPDFDAAVAAAKDVDVIVACVGENSYCETPGNLDELRLSSNQIDLVKLLSKTGKPIILVLNEGRPRIIREIEPLTVAILQTYLPGNYGGSALADILSGDVNPSGRLPYTYPKFEHSLTTYDQKPAENIHGEMAGVYNYGATASVQYDFGYGLSYTSFEYSNLQIDRKDFRSGDVIKVSVDVTNTGDRIGKESVLLFTSDLVASLTPDVRRLRAFDKVELKPGETKTVTLEVAADDLAFVDNKGKWILESGEFKVQVGNLIDFINCEETLRWETPNR